MDGTGARTRLLFPALKPLYDSLEPLSWLLIRAACGVTLAVHGWGKVSRGAEALRAGRLEEFGRLIEHNPSRPSAAPS